MTFDVRHLSRPKHTGTITDTKTQEVYKFATFRDGDKKYSISLKDSQGRKMHSRRLGLYAPSRQGCIKLAQRMLLEFSESIGVLERSLALSTVGHPMDTQALKDSLKQPKIVKERDLVSEMIMHLRDPLDSDFWKSVDPDGSYGTWTAPESDESSEASEVETTQEAPETQETEGTDESQETTETQED